MHDDLHKALYVGLKIETNPHIFRCVGFQLKTLHGKMNILRPNINIDIFYVH